MTTPARPRRAFVLALLAACGAGASASSGTEAVPRYEPVSEPASSPRPAKSAACPLTSKRYFVAFSDGMSLEDFDLAAQEAKQIMALTELLLCERADALEPSGALSADLVAQHLEAFEVRFVRDDAGAADVGLRRLDSPNDERGVYRVAVERTEQGWRLTGVTRL